LLDRVNWVLVLFVCLVRRQNFHYLVTGDTHGYVKVWYLAHYADAAAVDGSSGVVPPPQPWRFQLLREAMILRILSVQQGRFTPPAAASDPDRTWTTPLLVTGLPIHPPNTPQQCIFHAEISWWAVASLPEGGKRKSNCPSPLPFLKFFTVAFSSTGAKFGAKYSHFKNI